jgi:uncharacterized protein
MKHGALRPLFRIVSNGLPTHALMRDARGIALEQLTRVLLATLVLSLLIGVSLGLLGGGGSILTVPILTYVAGMAAKDAIMSAMFVVAVTSAVGLIGHARAGRVMWGTGIWFGASGMVGAFLGGRVAAVIPAHILMVAFGVMMAVTAIAMMRRPTHRRLTAQKELALGKAAVLGLLIGALTGLLGVGGGFLIVPALVLFARTSMQQAIGTSLLVICMNSVAGFAGHLGHASIHWGVTLAVAAVAVTGSVLGAHVAGRVPPVLLRRAFALLVAIVAVVVLFREIGI